MTPRQCPWCKTYYVESVTSCKCEWQPVITKHSAEKALQKAKKMKKQLDDKSCVVGARGGSFVKLPWCKHKL